MHSPQVTRHKTTVGKATTIKMITPRVPRPLLAYIVNRIKRAAPIERTTSVIANANKILSVCGNPLQTIDVSM